MGQSSPSSTKVPQSKSAIKEVGGEVPSPSGRVSLMMVVRKKAASFKGQQV